MTDRDIGRTDKKGRIVVFTRFYTCYDIASMGSESLDYLKRIEVVKSQLEAGLLKEQEAIELL